MNDGKERKEVTPEQLGQLRALNRELLEIRRDKSQNRILHMPLPDRSLEKFVQSVNGTLEQSREESRACAEGEREF